MRDVGAIIVAQDLLNIGIVAVNCRYHFVCPNYARNCNMEPISEPATVATYCTTVAGPEWQTGHTKIGSAHRQLICGASPFKNYREVILHTDHAIRPAPPAPMVRGSCVRTPARRGESQDIPLDVRVRQPRRRASRTSPDTTSLRASCGHRRTVWATLDPCPNQPTSGT